MKMTIILIDLFNRDVDCDMVVCTLSSSNKFTKCDLYYHQLAKWPKLESKRVFLQNKYFKIEIHYRFTRDFSRLYLLTIYSYNLYVHYDFDFFYIGMRWRPRVYCHRLTESQSCTQGRITSFACTCKYNYSSCICMVR